MLYPKDHFRLAPLSDETLHADTEQLTRALNNELDRRPAALGNLNFFEEKVTYDRERRYLEKMLRSDKDEIFLVREGEYDTLVGTAGFHEIDLHVRNARIGVVIIDTSARGRGFGSKAIAALLERAFSDLKLNKVYLNVFAENEKGRKLYAKLGFVEAGRLRQEYLLRGRYHDMIRMEMLKSEWFDRVIKEIADG